MQCESEEEKETLENKRDRSKAETGLTATQCGRNARECGGCAVSGTKQARRTKQHFGMRHSLCTCTRCEPTGPSSLAWRSSQVPFNSTVSNSFMQLSVQYNQVSGYLVKANMRG